MSTLLLVWLTSVCSAEASGRVALVIGNGAYTVASELRNPVNDALAIRDKLISLGFAVTIGTDLRRWGFKETVQKFSRQAEKAKVAVFFYAGHGLQVDGENYILPINADIERKADLDWHAVKVSTILQDIEGPERTSIIILDACRDNPLTRRLRALNDQNRTMNVGRGLARMTARSGSYIAFATSPDDVAADGAEQNSPFTTALVKHIDTPDLDIAQLMRRVRADVRHATGGRQTPWSNSSLIEDFAFRPTHQKVTPLSPNLFKRKQTDPTTSLKIPEAWTETKKIGNCLAYQEFARTFPKHFYAKLAQAWQRKNCQSIVKSTILPTPHAPGTPEHVAITATPKQAAKPPQITNAQIKRLEEELNNTRRKKQAELVKRIQRHLKSLKCYRGSIDGIFGTVSRAAWRKATKGRFSQREVEPEDLEILKKSGKPCSSTPRSNTRNSSKSKTQSKNLKPTTSSTNNKGNSSACSKWLDCKRSGPHGPSNNPSSILGACGMKPPNC